MCTLIFPFSFAWPQTHIRNIQSRYNEIPQFKVQLDFHDIHASPNQKDVQPKWNVNQKRKPNKNYLQIRIKNCYVNRILCKYVMLSYWNTAFAYSFFYS